MKRTLLTLILSTAALVGVSAQTAVERLSDPSLRLVRSDVWSLDTLQLDSLYDRWNDYVLAHPKDEQAWRNLFEIHNERSVRISGKEQLQYKEQKNVVGRMEEAIPDSYIFNYCAYESYYPKEVGEPYDWEAYVRVHNQYAERAIELLPKDAQANDYDTWIIHLIREKAGQDSTQLTDLWQANAWQLMQEGIPTLSIHISGLCTYSNPSRFFSARRLGINSGRMFTGIMKREELS